MAPHKGFPQSPHAILDPGIRWFPADEALRESSMEKLMPPLVPELRRQVKGFRDGGYVGAADTSRSLLNWWFNSTHLLPKADGTMTEFQYYFAQREALETIEYLEEHYPDLKDAVLVIHTKNNGDISESASGKDKEELEKLRKQANEIDGMDSLYKTPTSPVRLSG